MVFLLGMQKGTVMMIFEQKPYQEDIINRTPVSPLQTSISIINPEFLFLTRFTSKQERIQWLRIKSLQFASKFHFFLMITVWNRRSGLRREEGFDVISFLVSTSHHVLFWTVLIKSMKKSTLFMEKDIINPFLSGLMG